MAKKRNHGFERSERARQKAAKKAARLVAQSDRTERRYKLVTFRAWAGGANP